MFKSPIDFAENIQFGKHTVLFYENAEYSRSISFVFLKSGIINREHCFYVTSEDDAEFFKKEFKETMFGPNLTYEYNTNSNLVFNENLLHLENFPGRVDNDMRDYTLTNNIINTVHRITQSKENNNIISDKVSKYSRIILKFNNKWDTNEQIEKNIHWEKNFRNTLLREALPNTSLLSTYPVDRIIETINGQSGLYSDWMSELLDLYDGVIYAKTNWKGVAFGLDEVY